MMMRIDFAAVPEDGRGGVAAIESVNRWRERARKKTVTELLIMHLKPIIFIAFINFFSISFFSLSMANNKNEFTLYYY